MLPSATSATAPAWQAVTNPVDVSASDWSVTVPVEDGLRLFRLRLP